jgi:hypothetical protein
MKVKMTIYPGHIETHAVKENDSLRFEKGYFSECHWLYDNEEDMIENYKQSGKRIADFFGAEFEFEDLRS